MLSLSAIQIRK